MRFFFLLPALIALLSFVAAVDLDAFLFDETPALRNWWKAFGLKSQVTQTGPREWLQTLTEFHNRHYLSEHGYMAQVWLHEQLKIITHSYRGVQIEKYEHVFNQSSFIVRIPGGKKSRGLVVISTYYDSAAATKDDRAPGAVDNGSTVVALLEALRVLALKKFNARNTIEFHFYAGTKGEYLGSQQIMSDYAFERKIKILALLNQADVGYSPTNKINIFADYCRQKLRVFTAKIATAHGGPIAEFSGCGYACGDHISAYTKGYPTVFVSGHTHGPEYRDTGEDTFDKVDFGAVVRHTKFTLAFLAEVAQL
ncbi:hypothetical protein QTJ16_006209 [Diplocarpon rosae]|uniref:Peptide hydrolase n=1 Tax=Diplocarpon rosae TaxID=946125 RepID=A0AAD9WCX5_9HELO|nr:hypothetical protein QTJ16_006209 [Diplocarpon rosae]